MKNRILCALLCATMLLCFASCKKTATHPKVDDTYVAPATQEVAPPETTNPEETTTAAFTEMNIKAGKWLVYNEDSSLQIQYTFALNGDVCEKYISETGESTEFKYEQTGDGEYVFHMGGDTDYTPVIIDLVDDTHMTITYTELDEVEELVFAE